MAENTSLKKAGRKGYLDVLRVLAILAVLLMHSTGSFDDTVRIHSIQWHVSIFFGSITRFAVPVFVMISGALMLGKEKIDLKRLYARNIFRLLAAYLFWSFFYTLVYSFDRFYGLISILSIKNLIGGTLMGGYFHLWYMPLIIGLYVLLPVLHHCIRGMRKEQIGYWVALSFLICFVLPLLRKIESFDRIFGESIDHFQAGFWGEYVLYFTLGYLLEKYELPPKMYKATCFAGLAGAVFTAAAVWIPSVRTGCVVDTFRMNNTPNVLFMSVALFVFVKKHVSQHEKGQDDRFLFFLSDLSFGVYFIHEFVLVEIYDLFFSESQSASVIFILFVACTVISYALIWAIRKLPKLSRYIT